MVDVRRYMEAGGKAANLQIDPEHAAILENYRTAAEIKALIRPRHPGSGPGRLWVVRDKRGALWFYQMAYPTSSWPDNLGRYRACTPEESSAIHVLCAYKILFDIHGPCGCSIIVREHPRPG